MGIQSPSSPLITFGLRVGSPSMDVFSFGNLFSMMRKVSWYNILDLFEGSNRLVHH